MHEHQAQALHVLLALGMCTTMHAPASLRFEVCCCILPVVFFKSAAKSRNNEAAAAAEGQLENAPAAEQQRAAQGDHTETMTCRLRTRKWCGSSYSCSGRLEKERQPSPPNAARSDAA